MAWIRVIDEEDAEGRLARFYARYAEPDGSVDNILKIHSVSPASIRPGSWARWAIQRSSIWL